MNFDIIINTTIFGDRSVVKNHKEICAAGDSFYSSVAKL